MNNSLESHKLNDIQRITSLVHGLGFDVMYQKGYGLLKWLVPLFLFKFATAKLATGKVASLWRFWGYRLANPQLILV